MPAHPFTSARASPWQMTRSPGENLRGGRAGAAARAFAAAGILLGSLTHGSSYSSISASISASVLLEYHPSVDMTEERGAASACGERKDAERGERGRRVCVCVRVCGGGRVTWRVAFFDAHCGCEPQGATGGETQSNAIKRHASEVQQHQKRRPITPSTTPRASARSLSDSVSFSLTLCVHRHS